MFPSGGSRDRLWRNTAESHGWSAGGRRIVALGRVVHGEGILTVVGGRADAIDDDWGSVESVIRLDAIDGTPVLDVKPFRREFEPDETRQPGWATELMEDDY